MTSTAEITKGSLIKELRDLPVYRLHRHNLRPWDRKLPFLVAQEADHQDQWEIEPPSPGLIFLMLVIFLVAYQAVWVLPVMVNYETLGATWKNIEIPGIIYNEPAVWMSLWVVSHLSSALTLWFVWLTRGFAEHIPELIPLAFAYFCECVWVDIAAFAKRLDAVLVDWLVITICVAITMGLLYRRNVQIGSLFLLPHFGLSVTMVIYAAAFYSMHGHTYVWVQDIPRQPTPTHSSS